MSVTSAMFTGVSGLLANAEGINVIGNNLANVNTVGFKSGRMLFSDMLSSNIGNNSQIGRGSQIQKVDNIFGQGSFESTELVTDLAIQGDTFFALGKPDVTAAVAVADAYYTRAGAFRLIPDATTPGNLYLCNPDGYRLLDSASAPIMFTAATFDKITQIGADGTIKYLNNTGALTTYASKIGTAAITDKGAMTKEGGTLYKSSAATVAAPNGTTEKVFSNSLEQSNVDMAAQFVKMILTQRAYSANSKTITTADEMTQEVLNLKR